MATGSCWSSHAPGAADALLEVGLLDPRPRVALAVGRGGRVERAEGLLADLPAPHLGIEAGVQEEFGGLADVLPLVLLVRSVLLVEDRGLDLVHDHVEVDVGGVLRGAGHLCQRADQVLASGAHFTSPPLAMSVAMPVSSAALSSASARRALMRRMSSGSMR